MSYTVAIADDEEMMRKGLTMMIPWQAWGYEVAFSADSGRTLIEFLEKHPVDVVLTDITMDDMTGIDVARYVHEHLPDTVTVIISGFVEFSFAQQALEHGVYKYMLKPVSIDDMRTLATELVPEIERRRHISHLESKYQDAILDPHDQLITEAVRGALKDDEGRRQRISSLSIADSFLYRKCAVLSFILSLPERERDDPASAFRNIASRIRVPVDFHVIYAEGEWIRALLTFSDKEALSLADGTDAFSQNLARELCSQSEIDTVWVYVEKLYDSVLEFCWEGFNGWDLPVLAGLERNGVNYDRSNCRHAFISAIRAGDKDGMRANLLNYMRVCAEPSHGIWHARFMARVLLWQMAQIVDEGGESFVFMPDEHEIVRAADAEQLCDFVMSCYDDMLVRRAGMGKTLDPVEQAKEYIAAHFDEDVSLIGLSDIVHIAPAYLSRLFHERTGDTFSEYLNTIRLTAAADKLTATDLSVSEISAQIGFRDQKYFARRFRQRFGLTPSEYREKGNDEE